MRPAAKQQDRLDLELLAATRLVHLNALAFGVACGLAAGFTLLVATIVLVLKGGPNPGAHLALLRQYFPGYRVSFTGSLIGLRLRVRDGPRAGQCRSTALRAGGGVVAELFEETLRAQVLPGVLAARGGAERAAR